MTAIYGSWIQMDFQSSDILSIYGMTTDNPPYAPKSWTLCGTNDLTTWYLLDTRSNITWTANIRQNFTPLNGYYAGNSYRYYRLIVQANGGDNGNITPSIFYAQKSPTEYIGVPQNVPVPGRFPENSGIASISSDMTNGHNPNWTMNNDATTWKNFFGTGNYPSGTYSGSIYTTVQTAVILVTSITCSPSSITNLQVNGTQELTVTVLPANATNKVVTYTSANTSIATVSATSLVTGLVTGVSVGGPINITISATDGSGVFTTVPVTVIAAVCFRETTRVLMSDRTFKAIKDIQRGDEILTDKKTGDTKKVARTLKYMATGKATQIPMHLIGNRRTIVCSSTHPFWINDTRRILAGDIEGTETIEISEWLYTIQFEDEGTYYVEGVKVDAVSPDHRKFKLPKELYFDQTKYKPNRVMKSEDDERRKKPNMTKNL